MLDYAALQFIWFLLIGALLFGYAMMDGFDLGVGFWHLFSKSEKERGDYLAAIGPFWDGNEVWLVTGGGALFAAFPAVYATVFSGFYLALILLLIGLIFRAVSIEFRNLIETPSWRKVWDNAFAVSSIVIMLLLGVALGNIIRGIELNENMEHSGGFFALLNPYALLVGVTGVVMMTVHGGIFLCMKARQSKERISSGLMKVGPLYLLLTSATGFWTINSFQRGYALLSWVFWLVALLSIALIFIAVKKQKFVAAFMASSFAILCQMSGAGASVFPFLVPDLNRPDFGLSLMNASSSEYTLSTMLIIALFGMPLVIGYTIYIHVIFRNKS